MAEQKFKLKAVLSEKQASEIVLTLINQGFSLHVCRISKADMWSIEGKKETNALHGQVTTNIPSVWYPSQTII